MTVKLLTPTVNDIVNDFIDDNTVFLIGDINRLSWTTLYDFRQDKELTWTKSGRIV